jgi:N-acetylneuraminic acid mutarotase
LNWQKVDQKGAIAYTPRTGQASAIVGDKIFIFGGQNFHDQKQYSDAFFYDISMVILGFFFNKMVENNTWETLNNQGKPDGRNSGSAVYDEKNNRVIVYGGANLSGPLNDLYAYRIGKKR